MNVHVEQKKKLNEQLEAKLKHIIKSTDGSGLLKQFLEIAVLAIVTALLLVISIMTIVVMMISTIAWVGLCIHKGSTDQ